MILHQSHKKLLATVIYYRKYFHKVFIMISDVQNKTRMSDISYTKIKHKVNHYEVTGMANQTLTVHSNKFYKNS